MLVDGRRAHWLPGDDDRPGLRGLTCGQLLDEAASAWPAHEALAYCAYTAEGLNLSWSFADLRDHARRAARALLASGLRPGDRIALWATNLPEWFQIQFAAAYAGLVLVPLNPLYTASEVAYVLRRAEVSALLVEPVSRGGVDLWSAAGEAAREVPTVRYQVSIGSESWEEFLAQADVAREDELDAIGVRGEDLAQIQFTSGTTGFPKGAMLRHGALTDNARMFATRADLRRHGRACSGMPQFHCGGSVLATMGCMATGSALMPLVTFNPAKAVETITAKQVTVLMAVPAMLLAIEAEMPSWNALASLERIVTGGSLVPPEIARRWHDELGVTFSITYGLTEASPVITQSSPLDSLALQVETVGRALPHVECDVADPSTGHTARIDEQGEVRVRGWSVMAGYFGDDRATAETITADGWLRTGDLGRMDSAGYLHITGRAKEMIIRGGENLYPAEIESALRSLPGVIEAFVIGVPDERYGEVPAAFVRLEPEVVMTLESMREGLRGRIARFKLPVHLRVVDELPLTSSGKVQKFKLRERFLGERATVA